MRLSADDMARLRQLLDDARVLNRLTNELENEAGALASDEEDFDDVMGWVLEYTSNRPDETTFEKFCKEAGVYERPPSAGLRHGDPE